MTKARVDVAGLLKVTGVDPKTAQRWLGGRVPHPCHRMAVAALLGEDEGYLWPGARPDVAPGAEATPEVVAAYGHRVDIPASKWNDLLVRARRSIDIVGYAFLFLPEQHVNLTTSVQQKCEAGCKVRIALADPHGAHLPERDALEGLNGTLAARIHMTLRHLEALEEVPGVELRYHDVHLYNAIYRFDDEMLVTPYLYRAHGFQHPALHLRRLGPYGIFASFAEQLETIWSESPPAEVSSPASV
jgi:hypothetical protein